MTSVPESGPGLWAYVTAGHEGEVMATGEPTVFATVKRQHRCPVCGGPFIYWPDKQSVEKREDGMYIHTACKEK